MAGPISVRSFESAMLELVDSTLTMSSIWEISRSRRPNVSALAAFIWAAASSPAAKWKLQNRMAINAAASAVMNAMTALVIEVRKVSIPPALNPSLDVLGSALRQPHLLALHVLPGDFQGRACGP